MAQRQQESQGRVAAAAPVAAAAGATPAAAHQVRQASAGPAVFVCPASLYVAQVPTNQDNHMSHTWHMTEASCGH